MNTIEVLDIMDDFLDEKERYCVHVEPDFIIIEVLEWD